MRCPVCSSSSASIVHTLPEYRVLLCGDCGLRYADPMRPAPHDWYETSELYSDKRAARRHKSPREILLSDWRYQQFARYAPPAGLRLLDVGCGVGEFVFLARWLGYDATGIDFDEGRVLLGRQVYSVPLQSAGIADLVADKQGDKYDIITLFDVLEHLENPVGAIRDLTALFKAGGHFVVSVPSWNRWPQWVGSRVDLPPHHLTLWTEQALRRALENAGLAMKVVHRKPLHGSDLFLSVRFRVGWLEGRSLFKKVSRLVLWLGVAYPLAHLLRLYPGSGGFSLFAIGCKP